MIELRRSTVAAVSLAAALFGTVAIHAQERADQSAALRLADLETMAIKNSPDVARAQAAVLAAEGRARQAGLYPNPTAGYMGAEIRTGPTLRGGQQGFFVDQTIVLGGKLGKRRDVADQEVKRAEIAVDEATTRARTGVRFAYFEALAANERVALLERLSALLLEAVQTSHGLFNAGQADRPDVLEIEIEAKKAEIELARARTQFDQARQQVAIVVGDPAAAGAHLEGRLEEAVPKVEPNLLGDILERSPELAEARADVERTRASVRAVRAERIPDLFVRGGALYNRELLDATNQPTGWEGHAEVGVTIPIFDRKQGELAAAEADVAAAEAALRQKELVVRSRFTEAFSAYEEASRTSATYRTDILPKADEAYRLYLDKYQQMQAAYPQVLIARRTWLQANLDYIDSLERLYRAALPLQGYLLTDATPMPAP
jgi:cobalt-zinc-cadmium efflux system outer membrane protein